MKRMLSVVVGALLLAAFLPASAGSQADAQVTIVDALTYDIDSPSPVTLCIDDVGQNLSVGDIVGPAAVTPGTYTYEIFFAADEDCTGTPSFAADFTFAAGNDVTVMLAWTAADDDVAIEVLDNDNSCVDPGTGRVTLRHGAWTSDGGPADLVSGTDTLIAGVPPHGQGSAELAAGDYPDTRAVEDGSLVAALGTMTVNEGEQLVIYLAGGNDGDSGAFTDRIPVEVCLQPTTTTTTTIPATTTTAAASPQPLTPTITG